METLHPTCESEALPRAISQPRLLSTRKAKQAAARRRRVPSPALRVMLGLATAVTLGFALFSAFALHAEPALRVEPSADEIRPAAAAPTTTSPAATRRADADATRSRDSLPRVRALDRSR